MRRMLIALVAAGLVVAGFLFLASACAGPVNPPKACQSLCQDPEGESCQQCLEEQQEQKEAARREQREQRRREAPPPDPYPYPGPGIGGGVPGSY
jgi:hypothetical protein